MESAEPGQPQLGPPPSLVFLLSKVGYATSRSFAACLEPLGLEARHFAVLNFIALDEGQSQQTLADALDIPASRMVTIVDELEHRGFIERRPHPTDRRARALYLTPAGEHTCTKLARSSKPTNQSSANTSMPAPANTSSQSSHPSPPSKASPSASTQDSPTRPRHRPSVRRSVDGSAAVFGDRTPERAFRPVALLRGCSPGTVTDGRGPTVRLSVSSTRCSSRTWIRTPSPQAGPTAWDRCPSGCNGTQQAPLREVGPELLL